MKELVHQVKNDYILWKNQDKYSLLLLINTKRRKEREYKLNEKDMDLYYKDGLNYIRKLVEKL